MDQNRVSPPSSESVRYERKFHILDRTPHQVEAMVKTAHAHFREVYPPRIVNNIYFDTPGLADFWKHANGSANRSKLRLRWYGPPRDVLPKPVLEVKAKHGHVGTKPSSRVNDLSAELLRDHRQLGLSLRSACSDPVIVERLANSSPALFNRYDRRYFCSADGRFRLTIDTNLSFHEASGRCFGPRRCYDEVRLIIVEVKYSVASESEINAVMRGWPFRVGRISKYVYGIRRLQGNDVELI